MIRLDQLDKKILFELDKNSRLSNPQLGRKVFASKEVVAYRINRLIREKVIHHFYSIIALTTLGYFNYKIYFQLQGLTEEKEQNIIYKLKLNNNIVWIATTEGRWDLMISFYAKNIQDFAAMKAEVFEMLGNIVQEYSIIINEDGFILYRDYLFSEKNRQRNPISYLGKIENITLDKRENDLLKSIATNSRLPIKEIAKACNYTTKTVLEKIRLFKKNSLIQSFTIGINLSVIDYYGFKIFIFLSDMSKESYSSVFNFCKELLPVRHIIKTIGAWELELEIETPNPRDLQIICKKLRSKFPNKIKKIESVTILNEVKLEFFPQKE